MNESKKIVLTPTPLICGDSAASRMDFLTSRGMYEGRFVKSPFYQNKVKGIRRCEDPEQRSRLKKNLAYICPNAQVPDALNYQHLREHFPSQDVLTASPWQLLDCDDLGDFIDGEDAMQHVNERMTALGMADYPYWMQISASDKLHIVVLMTPRQQAMRRIEVIREWEQVLGLPFDYKCQDVARRMFVTHELFRGEKFDLMFGTRQLTDSEWQAIETLDALIANCQAPTAPCHPEQREGSLTPYRDDTTSKNLLELPQDVALTDVVEAVVKAVCGKDKPVEGERNETIFRAVKELSYIYGITTDALVGAFSALGFYGLTKSEVTAAVASGLKAKQFWEMKPSPTLTEVVEGLQQEAEAEAAEVVAEDDATGHSATVPQSGMELPFNPFSDPPPAMPELKDMPTFPRFLVKNVPLSTLPHCFNELEPAIATYLCNTTTTDINGSLLQLGSGWLAFSIAPMSSGKSSRNEPLRRIKIRMKGEDEAARQKVEEWNALARRTKTEDLPEKPSFSSHLMGSDATSAALLLRLKQLKEGALLITVDELSMLTALQSSSSDTKSPLLLAFSQEDWTVERSTEMGESGSVEMRLNVSAMGTPYQAHQFFQNGYHSGLLSRISASTILNDGFDDDDFYYKPYDDAYQDTLEKYIDKLVAQQHQHLECKAIERHVKKLRRETLDLAAAFGSDSLRVLARRQCIIAQRRAFLYWILNDMKFTKKLEEFLTWRFRYGLWALYYTLGDTIRKEEEQERGTALKKQRSTAGAGPTNWLSLLPSTFTEQQLIELRKKKSAAVDRHSVQKLLSTWKNRGYIQPDEETPGTWRNLKKS